MIKLFQYAVIIFALLAIPAGVTFANHIGDGINQIIISWRNLTGNTLEHIQAPFNLSSVALSESLFIAPDAMNVDMRESGDHVAFMPGTGRIDMLGCVNGSAVNETAECIEDTADDMIFPITPAGTYEFVADNQFRVLHLQISTPVIASAYTIQWEYWNGSAYVALSNVLDGTDNLSKDGLHTITFDFPAAGLWPQATLHSIEGYWIQMDVQTATSVTQNPLGQEAWYETGRWWTLLSNIEPAEEGQHNLHLDVADSDRTYHQYFPHADGTVLADDATVELTGSYSVSVDAYFDTTAPITGSAKKIAFKDSSIEVTVPAAGIIQAKIYEAP